MRRATILLLLTIVACSRVEPASPSAEEDAWDTYLRRARVDGALWEHDLWGGNRDAPGLEEARAELDPLLRRAQPAAQDVHRSLLLRLYGVAALEPAEREVALDSLELGFERLLEDEPLRARAHYGLAWVSRERWDLDHALHHLLLARQHAPASLCTQLLLARRLIELDRLLEAANVLRALRARGREACGDKLWFDATWALWRAVQWTFEAQGSSASSELASLRAEWEELHAQGVSGSTRTELQRGDLGRPLWPEPPAHSAAPTASRSIALQLEPLLRPDAPLRFEILGSGRHITGQWEGHPVRVPVGSLRRAALVRIHWNAHERSHHFDLELRDELVIADPAGGYLPPGRNP